MEGILRETEDCTAYMPDSSGGRIQSQCPAPNVRGIKARVSGRSSLSARDAANESLGKAVVEEGGNIARSLRHGHNFNGP